MEPALFESENFLRVITCYVLRYLCSCLVISIMFCWFLEIKICLSLGKDYFFYRVDENLFIDRSEIYVLCDMRITVCDIFQEFDRERNEPTIYIIPTIFNTTLRML